MFPSWSTSRAACRRVVRYRPLFDILEERSLLSSAASETVVHPFGGQAMNLSGQMQADGVQPEGNVTLADNGSVIYGRTFTGGTGGTQQDPGGVIYRVNADGSDYTILHNFTGSSTSLVDGLNPRHNAMTLSSDGSTLYGMTVAGGAHGLGTIFSYAIDTNSFQVLHSFKGGKHDGATSHGSIVLSADGTTMYGMTAAGGAQNKGVLFQMNTDGSHFHVLWTFGQDKKGNPTPRYGTEPHATPTLVGAHLYGMTRKGGVNDNGVLFDFDLKTGQMTTLHPFAGSPGDGATSYHGQVLYSHGVLYGMTTLGGNVTDNKADGIIYSYDLATGHYRPYLFPGPTKGGKNAGGARPEGSLVLVDGKLYGVTSEGGTHGQGVLFRIDPSLQHLKILYNFHATHGDHPIDSVTPVVNGSTLTFYGMTQQGGTNHDGTIFAVQVPASG
jgi:uncharacterized repeat protein (TIGR03803 family)